MTETIKDESSAHPRMVRTARGTTAAGKAEDAMVAQALELGRLERAYAAGRDGVTAEQVKVAKNRYFELATEFNRLVQEFDRLAQEERSKRSK